MGSPWASMATWGCQNYPWTTTNFSRSISILVQWIYAFSLDHHMHSGNDWVGIYWVAFLYRETWQQQVLSLLGWPRKIGKNSNIEYVTTVSNFYRDNLFKKLKNVSPGIYIFSILLILIKPKCIVNLFSFFCLSRLSERSWQSHGHQRVVSKLALNQQVKLKISSKNTNLWMKFCH